MHAPRFERFAWLAQVAAISAFSWLVWVNVVAPGWRDGGLAPILAEAALFVLTAWAVSAFALLWVYVLVSATVPVDTDIPIIESLRSAAPAMWFAPAMILMSVLEPAPTFAGLILLINVTSILVRRWTRLRGFTLPGPLFRSSLPSLAGGLAIQSGAVALWLDYRLFAAGLFFGASAILTAQTIVAGAYRPKKDPLLPPVLFSPAVAFLLALALTFKGIQMGTQGREGTIESARSIFRRLWHTPRYPAEPKQAVTNLYLPKDPDPAQASNTSINGGFPGVVLRAKRKPEKQLTAPPRPAAGERTEALSRPLHIPFTGEYWLYQAYLAPLSSPPSRSAIRFGNPLELSFHTADYRPMRMEAHQRLDPPLGLDCCSSIQLVVAHRGFNQPVAVNLSAIDTTKFMREPGRETSLGTAVMGPDPFQTLTFSVPPSGKARTCYEFQAVFRLEQFDGLETSAQSLHVEIQEIILTP